MDENMILRLLKDEIKSTESQLKEDNLPDDTDITVSASEDEMKLYWSLNLSA